MRPSPVHTGLLLTLVLAATMGQSADSRFNVRAPSRLDVFPSVVLWAWERPEDFTYLDPRQAGVAFLARTVFLDGGDVAVRPRFQPLSISPGTVLMAVVRIETRGHKPLELSAAQRAAAAAAIVQAASVPGIAALQIDFDALASQREFYRGLIFDVRRALPPSLPLSITALASWCIGDDWLEVLPIDEAVPMLFQMGPDGANVSRFLAEGHDFRAHACRQSAGIAAEEPRPALSPGRRLYIFPSQRWTPESVRAALLEVQR